jgi:uncharacterized protein DUF5678
MTQTSVLQMLKSGQNDLAWFESNLINLRSKYNNKFIAFHNNQVIDADINVDNLMKKLKEKSVDTSNVFVKFVSKIKAIL